VIRRLLGKKKERFEEIARERLLGSAAFPVVRTAYQSVFNRGKLQSRRQMKEFYSQFVSSGDLVFDVGANVGMYSEIFAELKARVVAIEPNPACLGFLQSLARRTSVVVEPRAISDQPGKIALQVSDMSVLSTANPEWRSMVERMPRYGGSHFTEEIEVESVTLDQLAGQYGVPQFVKIDVEGFDDRVMFGMSFQPFALSFEFNRTLPDVAKRCLTAPVVSSGYEFNFQKIGEMRFASSKWLELAEFAGQLENLACAGDDEYGDIIARRKALIAS
jgi:FkbM family methyltransferase